MALVLRLISPQTPSTPSPRSPRSPRTSPTFRHTPYDPRARRHSIQIVEDEPSQPATLLNLPRSDSLEANLNNPHMANYSSSYSSSSLSPILASPRFEVPTMMEGYTPSIPAYPTPVDDMSTELPPIRIVDKSFSAPTLPGLPLPPNTQVTVAGDHEINKLITKFMVFPQSDSTVPPSKPPHYDHQTNQIRYIQPKIASHTFQIWILIPCAALYIHSVLNKGL